MSQPSIGRLRCILTAVIIFIFGSLLQINMHSAEAAGWKAERRQSRQTVPIPFDPAQFAQEALFEHNRLRNQHCALPLAIDAVLTREAQRIVSRGTQTGQLLHSLPDSISENFWIGVWAKPFDPPTGTTVTDQWYKDSFNYDPKRLPGAPATGPTLGFINMIWRSSKSVGFAAAPFPNGTWFVIALYFPAPQQAGLATNVLPKTSYNCDKAPPALSPLPLPTPRTTIPNTRRPTIPTRQPIARPTGNPRSGPAGQTFLGPPLRPGTTVNSGIQPFNQPDAGKFQGPLPSKSSSAQGRSGSASSERANPFAMLPGGQGSQRRPPFGSPTISGNVGAPFAGRMLAPDVSLTTLKPVSSSSAEAQLAPVTRGSTSSSAERFSSEAANPSIGQGGGLPESRTTTNCSKTRCSGSIEALVPSGNAGSQLANPENPFGSLSAESNASPDVAGPSSSSIVGLNQPQQPGPPKATAPEGSNSPSSLLAGQRPSANGSASRPLFKAVEPSETLP